MEPLHDALIKRMNNFGLEKALTATKILEAANRILPPEVRAKTYKNGVLTVESATSADGYFFKQEIDTYLERINAALEKPTITNIRIRVTHA